jgi:dTMP kinase
MLIAFEGGEGTGKSTQARLLAERLGAVLTHEPGATPSGVRLRALLLDPASGALDPRTEALLMAADRAEHVASVIAPALAAGTHVVTDRYVYSSLAYQGYGRGLDLDEVRALSTFAGAPEADLVVLLTVPAAVRDQRLGASLDRFERDGDDFHNRVAAGFVAMATADPGRWVVIDGDAATEAVADDVWHAVEARLPSPA